MKQQIWDKITQICGATKLILVVSKQVKFPNKVFSTIYLFVKFNEGEQRNMFT